MKVQAKSYTNTTVTGEVSEQELLTLLVAAGLHIPTGAQVLFWVKNNHADAHIDEDEPLRFSISWKSEPVTTPPASDADDTQSEATRS